MSGFIGVVFYPSPLLATDAKFLFTVIPAKAGIHLLT